MPEKQFSRIRNIRHALVSIESSEERSIRHFYSPLKTVFAVNDRRCENKVAIPAPFYLVSAWKTSFPGAWCTNSVRPETVSLAFVRRPPAFPSLFNWFVGRVQRAQTHGGVATRRFRVASCYEFVPFVRRGGSIHGKFHRNFRPATQSEISAAFVESTTDSS